VQAERGLASGGFLRGGDFAFRQHLVKDQVAPGERALRIIERRIDRPANHTGEESRLLQLQVADRLAKIKLRGGGKPVVAVRQVDLVGVHGEDLRLGVAALDLQREQHLLHLAAEGAVAAVKEEVAGQLHGDGAGAFRFAALQQVTVSGPRDAREIDSPVILKVLVFDAGDGIEEYFGALLVGHEDAALQGEAADHLAVIGVDLRHHIGAVGFKRANLRQVARVHKEQAAGGSERDGAEKQEGQGDAVNQFPAAQPQGDGGKTQHRKKILAQMDGRYVFLQQGRCATRSRGLG